MGMRRVDVQLFLVELKSTDAPSIDHFYRDALRGLHHPRDVVVGAPAAAHQLGVPTVNGAQTRIKILFCVNHGSGLSQQQPPPLLH